MKPVDGRQLKAARAILGLTVVEAATLASIHRNSVLLLESREDLKRCEYSSAKLGEAYEKKGIRFGRDDGRPVVAF